LTKVFGRVKLESEETNLWQKRKQKRNLAVAAANKENKGSKRSC
jgi:hypothetical protein